MLFWGIFYPSPPPPVMLFYAFFNIVVHADPNPHPEPLRHDSIYGRPQGTVMLKKVISFQVNTQE